MRIPSKLDCSANRVTMKLLSGAMTASFLYSPIAISASQKLPVRTRHMFKALIMFVVATATITAFAQGLTTATGTYSPADLVGVYAGTVRPFTLKITNTGTEPLQVTRITIPSGIRQWGGNSCYYPTVPSGGNCIFELAVGSDVPGAGAGEIVIEANVPTGSFSVPVTWTIAPFPIHVSAQSLAFGGQQVGTVSAPQTLVVTNVGTSTFALTAFISPSYGCLPVPPPSCIEFIQEEIASFPVETTCTALAPQQSCKVEVAFAPQSQVAWRPSLVINTADTARSIGLSGAGVLRQKVAGTVLAVSYVRAKILPLRWFLTVAPDEIDKLDAGMIAGWERTGESFWVYPSDFVGSVSTNPVCRFYGRPEAGVDGHFYTASSDECAQVVQRFPNAWQLESESFFRASLPDFVTGICPSGMAPIYRRYSSVGGDHHVYTTFRDWEVGRGGSYVSEGYGPDGVVMCAAQ